MRDDWDLEFVPRLLATGRVSLGAASALCRIARRAAREDGVAISVAVVDPGGVIIMAERMDSADTPSLDAAAAAARSCVLPASVEPLGAVGVGVALRHEGALVGAIGVAPDLDHAIAAGAAAALGQILRPATSD